MPLIAMTFAVVAVAVALVAAFGVLTRDDAPAASASAPTVAGLSSVIERRLSASDITKLVDRGAVETVVEAGLPRGLRVTDAKLVALLGLESDDVIVALSGRPTTRLSDLGEALHRTGMMGATTLYVELERGPAKALARWHVDGSLLDARRDAIAANVAAAGLGSAGGSGSPIAGALANPVLKNPFASDPVLDSIEKLDDTHYRLPRATFHALIADATTLARGARFVPAVKNGFADGFKIYAIRPSSAFGRLGLTNGDTIRAINGEELSEVDNMGTFFLNLKRSAGFRVDITRRGQPVALDIQITK